MPRHGWTGAALGAALWLTLTPHPGAAQDYQRIAPRAPQAAPAPPVTAPAPPPPAPAADVVLLPALRGLVFVPDPSAVQAGGIAPATLPKDGILATGLPLLGDPGFTAQLAPFLGQKLRFADLQQIERLTTAFYSAHDRPFVAVTAPPQNVSSGVVQIVVSEYRVGDVTVAGNRWFAADLLARESGLTPGEPLTLSGVQADLDWLNANPFRRVEAQFQPGRTAGTTDVVLNTQDRLPVRVYASFDEAGAPSLGRGEWSTGATWGNVAGLDQTLSYQFTRSLTGQYDAHSLSWSVPLPWRDKLSIFGSYARETPDVPRFGETGDTGQASIRYVDTLPPQAIGTGLALTHNLALGYDFKTSNNNLEFGGTRVFTSSSEIDQFPLIYDATLTDPYGQTALENQLVLSPGGITGANTTKLFSASVPGATADYAYDRIGLTRTTFLPKGFSWSSRVVGQLSDRNLLDSEQLGAGGPDSVRGYFTDTALGAKGVLVSEELRGPAFSLSEWLHGPVSDMVQPGLFWDYAHVAQVRTIPDAVNSADLSSLGVDLHATLDRYVDVTFNLGWQQRPAPGSDKRGAFGTLAVIVGY
jgi:hemolysin activation/secretion protein